MANQTVIGGMVTSQPISAPLTITFNSFNLLACYRNWRRKKFHLEGHVKNKYDDDFVDLYEIANPMIPLSIPALSHLHLQYGIGITKTIVGYNDQDTLDKLPWDWNRPSNLDDFERRTESDEHSKIRYLFRFLATITDPKLLLYPCNIGISGVAGMADMLLVNEQNGKYCFVEIATSTEIQNPERLSNKLRLNSAVPMTFVTDIRNDVSPLTKAGITSILLADLDRGMLIPSPSPNRPCFNCKRLIELKSLNTLKSQFDSVFDSEDYYKQTDLGSVAIRLSKKLRLARERHHYGSLCRVCLTTWIKQSKDKETRIRRRPLPPRPSILPPIKDKTFTFLPDMCTHSFSPCSCEIGPANYKGK